jgi:hypothetical protein
MLARVVVIGSSGSGKTTLGRWLGRTFDLPFTDLDDVYWRPGWGEAPTEEFRADVDRITGDARWVVVGNYAKARDLIWPRADTLVWLDLPLPLVLWRTTRRVIRQARSGEPVCNGNRQHLGALVFGSDPLLGYTLRTHHRNRRHWPDALREPQHAHLHAVRLRSRREVAAWQACVQRPGQSHRREPAGQAPNTPVDR